MGSLTVKVNGRSYPIVCGDGEEQHLEYLAEFVDKKVQDLTESIGNASEGQLLMMASLLIADDLSQAYETIEKLREEAEEGSKSVSQDDWAEKIEAIAQKLESA
ncbi:cell division protein ZapA [uncultured Sneathiella sp.]|jgi:cell division protein ZapA|uniref:cell division protein ZapA n=1 Tax=uncultured Sneathiella sp. TaxID=879315 RepID=UPI0030DBDFAA|tara:strand:+ start:318 stop:629 length:312 start_codon:yes stop_codon:yes gene_type:complete